jgi:hypothetical protein
MGDHGLRYIRTSGFKGIKCTDRVAMELFVLRKYCCVTYEYSGFLQNMRTTTSLCRSVI